MISKTCVQPIRRTPRISHRVAGGKDLRRGDWICLYCYNHNFSFRQVCNRCEVNMTLANEENEYSTVTAVTDSHSTLMCSLYPMRVSNEAAVYSLFPKAILLAACENDLSL
jgi:hypothetical protein